jgi:hypothetical protein
MATSPQASSSVQTFEKLGFSPTGDLRAQTERQEESYRAMLRAARRHPPGKGGHRRREGQEADHVAFWMIFSSFATAVSMAATAAK